MLNALKKNKKVFVGMSGGVDSSVTALLLKERGYDVVGVFMRCYNIDGCAEQDAEDARRVAEKLEIPFYAWDFEEEYKKKVVDYMVAEYKAGLTPNPDVACNKEIKFGLFFDRAIVLGADYVATGHYVGLGQSAFRNRGSSHSSGEMPAASHSDDSSRPSSSELRELPQNRPASPLGLYIAKDKNKDQSYFLWTLTKEQLAHCLFPIGDYEKPEVRAIAKKAGLPTAEKKDSQGICFLGKVTLADFLKNYIPEKKGTVLNTAGKKLGEHNGAHFYTIGQRHIGVANSKSRMANSKGDTKPVYVTEKNVKTNTLTVAEGSENEALYRKEVELRDVHFINPMPEGDLDVRARVRYRQPLSKAKLIHPSAGSGFRLIFDKAQKFVAPGQSAVFYSEEGEMLGGGVIA